MEVLRTVLAVVAALLLIVAMSSLAAGGEELVGVEATLTFLAAGGAAIGAVVSQVLEDFEWFQSLTSAWREIVVKLATFGLPIAAGVILKLIPRPVPEPFDQLWVIAMMAVLSFLGSQAWHFAANRGR
jgi:hypothetical protein